MLVASGVYLVVLLLPALVAGALPIRMALRPDLSQLERNCALAVPASLVLTIVIAAFAGADSRGAWSSAFASQTIAVAVPGAACALMGLGLAVCARAREQRYLKSIALVAIAGGLSEAFAAFAVLAGAGA